MVLHRLVLYRRKKVSQSGQGTLGLDVYESRSSKDEYIRTIAPANDASGLAQEVLNCGLRLSAHDLITTISPKFIPTNGYIDLPVDGEEITGFWSNYFRLSESLQEKR